MLLQRYGIVFRKLLDQERNIPAWRDLHYVLRRMEARGEIRGGRFVNGLAGEQFALPEAVGLLRKTEADGGKQLLSISAADPLNLTGSVLPGNRVPGVRSNRLLFRGGRLIATYIAGEVTWLETPDPSREWEIRQALTKKPGGKPGKFR